MPDEPEELATPEDLPIPPRAGKKKRGGTRARVEVEGEVGSAVMDRVLSSSDEKPKEGEEGGFSQRFEKAIKNLNNRITARRTSPLTMPDGTPLSDEMELNAEPSLTEQQIKNEIAEARGGKRWFLSVYDANDVKVAAKTIAVHGEPKLPIELVEMNPSDGRDEMGEEFQQPEDVDALLERDKDIIAQKKRIAMLKLKQEETALMGGSPTNGKQHEDDDDARTKRIIEDATAPLRAQNEALQRQAAERQADEKTKGMIEAANAPMKAALDTIMQKLSAPQGGDLASKLENMELRMQQNTKSLIDATLAGIKSELSSKIDSLTNLVHSKQNDPATTALVNLATKSGSGGPAQDPFSMMERTVGLVKSVNQMTGMTPGGNQGPMDLPSLIVEKVGEIVPQVMEFYKDQGTLQKAAVEAKIKELGGQMYAALDSTIKSEIRAAAAQQQRPMIPPPASGPAAPAVPAAPAAGQPAPVPPPFPPPAPVTQAPAPNPFSQPAPTAPVQEGQPQVNIDDVKRKRVNAILNLLNHEIQVGAQAMSWPEKAYGYLPKDIVDAIVKANNDTELYEAIKPWADPTLMETIWAFLRETNPQHAWYRDWVSRGINWMKEEAGVIEGEEQDPMGEGEMP